MARGRDSRLDAELVKDAYMRLGTLAATAQEMNVAPSTIRRVLIKAGFLRPEGWAGRAQATEKAVDMIMLYSEVGQRLSVTRVCQWADADVKKVQDRLFYLRKRRPQRLAQSD
jgi:hypothetical protein